MNAAYPILPLPREFTLSGGNISANTLVRYQHDASLPAEGYEVEIAPALVLVRHADEAGRFYARQTLRQLVRDGRLPCCSIRDWPEYPWRGVMVDEGRHFFGKEAIKHLLQQMAMVKMNVLHWHLTEDQGWRIDIPCFPELIQWGAKRSSSPLRPTQNTPDGISYGPFFYTADDIREIVSFAAERHIKVVPEIEIPGHVRALLAARPEFNCQGYALDERAPWPSYDICKDVLCIGNDDAIRYLERIFDEVMKLFPDDVIHIGGDEAPTDHWKTCPLCQARMKTEGLKTERELQSWIVRHFVRYMKERGRRVCGWDEIAEAGLPAGAIIQSWRTYGWQNASGSTDMASVVAAKAGLDVINSPHDRTYFSYPNSFDDPPIYRCPIESYHEDQLVTMENLYAFDPRANVPGPYRKHILGSEACNWSAGTLTPDELQIKMWPRGLAMAEILWSSPSDLCYKDFLQRIASFSRRYGKTGTAFFPF